MTTITVTVKKLDQTIKEKVDADLAWLTDEKILKENSSLINITGDLELPVLGENGSNIEWISSDPTIVTVDGKVNRPSFTKGNVDGEFAVAAVKGYLVFSDEDPGLELMPRDYSGRPSVWLAGEETTLFSRSFLALNPDIRSLMENIYPEAEPVLIVNGSERWLVWTDDNPERDAVNRTQLRYSVQKYGLWQEPVWIDDDGTADFTPAVAAVENGVLMAWHDINKAITGVCGSDERGL